MKEQPTQREELEERGEISERRETRGRREAPRRRRERQSPQVQINLPLILSALALIVSIAALFFALRPEQAEEPPAPSPSTEEPVTFRFGDRTLTAHFPRPALAESVLAKQPI